MSIRTATLEDVKDIARIHVTAWQVAYKGLIPQSYLDKLSIAKREQSWSNILTDSKTHTVVQEINGAVVGFANFGHSRDQDRDSSVTGEITSIYINPEYWRKGLGTALFEFIFKEIKNREFTEVTLWVIDTNQTACSFYKKMGLKPDGTTKIDIREDFELKEIRYLITII
ncbi:N-acetyltransferase family protein [Calothrix sp. CCY 0018]|uniref:GNAT family N-acetyltransferase n=1 Tax=Calothrix sp. CCY 0018 TaxID=3103864 RepID=UPI0039C6F66E